MAGSRAAPHGGSCCSMWLLSPAVRPAHPGGGGRAAAQRNQAARPARPIKHMETRKKTSGMQCHAARKKGLVGVAINCARACRTAAGSGGGGGALRHSFARFRLCSKLLASQRVQAMCLQAGVSHDGSVVHGGSCALCPLQLVPCSRAASKGAGRQGAARQRLAARPPLGARLPPPGRANGRQGMRGRPSRAEGGSALLSRRRGGCRCAGW